MKIIRSNKYFFTISTTKSFVRNYKRVNKPKTLTYYQLSILTREKCRKLDRITIY